MAQEHTHAPPNWFVAPGEADTFAWVAFAFVCLALYGVVTLYAAFDRWAEHQAQGTPLAKTIPTLLAIALLYELFPLDHFSVLLPLSAILIALMADWARFHMPSTTAVPHDATPNSEPVKKEPAEEQKTAEMPETAKDQPEPKGV